MGFESSALDAVTEVEEHSELETSPTIPGDDEFEASPDIPVDESDGFHLESVEDLEDVESLLTVESGKASAVIGLAESTVSSAIKTTGNASMFTDEVAEIEALNAELKVLTENEADLSSLISNTEGISSLSEEPPVADGVGLYETNSSASAAEAITSNETSKVEFTESLFPENITHLDSATNILTEARTGETTEKPLKIMGTEFQNLSESERFTVERASNIVYYPSEKAQNPDELHGLVEDLKVLSTKEFPDDAKFEASLAVIMDDMAHRFADMPVILDEGALDMTTGKKSSIEIIDNGKYTPKVEKPTEEQLDEANKILMATTRGRVMDMLAYMQDYEAVAKGKLGDYQKGMPDSRMRELKRKSWFSELEHANNRGSIKTSSTDTVSSLDLAKEESSTLAHSKADATIKPETRNVEVISGLTLTWESAADYYEGIGNKAYAEFIRDTGKFSLTELPNGDSVVGETHLRLLNNPEYQEKFDGLLRKLKPKSLIIVEHNSDSEKNGWTQLSAEERFMQQAEDFANDATHDLELEVMDSSIKEPFDAWEEAKMDELISEEDYSFLQGMKEASEKIVQQNGIEDLVESIEANQNMSPNSRTARLLGITRFISKLAKGGPEASQYIQQLMDAKATLLEIDSFCREVHYQNIVAQKKQEDLDRTVLVIVGNTHSNGIEQTILDKNYRTRPNITKAQNLKQFIESQR